MNRTNKKQFQVTEEILASHSQRFLNWFADGFMQVVLLFVIMVFMSAIALSNGNKEFMINFVKNDIAQCTVAVCIALFYYNFFEIFFARTIGKFITNTIVVDENGEKPHHDTILIRSLCRLIPFEMISFIGIPARGWHDSLSKTFVVDKRVLDEKKRKFYTLQETKTE